MLALTLLVAALTAARLARLVAEDEITVGLRRAIVNRFGPTSWPSKLVHCAPWCMSFWCSLLLPVNFYWPSTLLFAIMLPFAGSMVAALLLRAADRE